MIAERNRLPAEVASISAINHQHDRRRNENAEGFRPRRLCRWQAAYRSLLPAFAAERSPTA